MRRKAPPARKSADNPRFLTYLAIVNLAADVGGCASPLSRLVPDAMSIEDVLRAGQVAVRSVGMWAADLALATVVDLPEGIFGGQLALRIVSAAQSLLCGAGCPSRAADLVAALGEALRLVTMSAPGDAVEPTRARVCGEIVPAMGAALFAVRMYGLLTPEDSRGALSHSRVIRSVLFQNGMSNDHIRAMAHRMRADVESTLTANLAPTGGLVDALGFISGAVGRAVEGEAGSGAASQLARITLDTRTALQRSRAPDVHRAVASGAYARTLIEKALTQWVPRLATWAIDEIASGQSKRPGRAARVASLRTQALAFTEAPTPDAVNALAECARKVALEFYDDDPGAWQPEIEAAQALSSALLGIGEARDMLDQNRGGARAAERVAEAVLCDGVAAMHVDALLPFARAVVNDIAQLLLSGASGA